MSKKKRDTELFIVEEAIDSEIDKYKKLNDVKIVNFLINFIN